MNDNLAILLIMTVAITAALILILMTSWMRLRHRSTVAAAAADQASLEAAGQVALLADENEGLKGKVLRLEDRLAVLEQIATDPAERTAREIDALRHA